LTFNEVIFNEVINSQLAESVFVAFSIPFHFSFFVAWPAPAIACLFLLNFFFISFSNGLPACRLLEKWALMGMFFREINLA
jgi:hypothetical protein